MANLFPSFIRANPAYVMPEIIMQYAQASGFTELLAGRDLMPRLGEADLRVYAKSLALRTQVLGQQVASNVLPTVTLQPQEYSTPSYLLRVHAEYDHHDIAAAGAWGVGLPEAQRMGMRQAIFQQVRSANLFGMGGAGEGLLNTVGATTTNLPADSNGNTTISTYDNGQMALYLLGLFAAILARTNQTGQPQRIAVLAPQRVYLQWELQGVVQLTSYQRDGAGVATTGEMVRNIAEKVGLEVDFAVDDTLINAGSGGNTDAIVIVMPEVKKPVTQKVNTNEFAELAQGLAATTIQLCDMVAPREIPTPMPYGVTDVMQEMRVTPGWALRPECVTILSAAF